MQSENVLACCKSLVRHKHTIAFAESATAGKMCSEFALAPESGTIVMGGIVCYSADIKRELMRVSPELIAKFTCESSEVTQSLCENLKNHFKSDIHVAITGLAGPGGSETVEKPVGTMFIHIKFPKKYMHHREVFKGNPEEVIAQAIDRTAELILSNLEIKKL